MRNRFRSSFRAAARSHGQLRSLSKCCSCMRDSASVRGLTYDKSERNQKAILITKAFCHPQTRVCVCVSWHWTLVTQFFLSSPTCCWVWLEVPHQPGQPLKFTVTESCDRIKEEFHFLQAQYHRWESDFEMTIKTVAKNTDEVLSIWLKSDCKLDLCVFLAGGATTWINWCLMVKGILSWSPREGEQIIHQYRTQNTSWFIDPGFDWS